jgi:hypothetical protein
MATYDFSPSRYGNFCIFFPKKKALVQFALRFFLMIDGHRAKIQGKKKHCSALPTFRRASQVQLFFFFPMSQFDWPITKIS